MYQEDLPAVLLLLWCLSVLPVFLLLYGSCLKEMKAPVIMTLASAEPEAIPTREEPMTAVWAGPPRLTLPPSLPISRKKSLAPMTSSNAPNNTSRKPNSTIMPRMLPKIPVPKPRLRKEIAVGKLMGE